MIVKAHFKDENHDCDVEFYFDNESDEHYCMINGIKFKVADKFSSLSLADNSDIAKAEKEFHLQKIGGTRTACGVTVTNPYHYLMQRYSLETEIPVTVISRQTGEDINAAVRYKITYIEHDEERKKYPHFSFLENEKVILDDAVTDHFCLIVSAEEYYADVPVFFDGEIEVCLYKLCQKIRDKYYLKCCYGCAYSDYCPYGGDGMECWRNTGDFYKFVRSKGNYEDMHKYKEWTTEFDLCDRFMIRDGDYGHRGGIYKK